MDGPEYETHTWTWSGAIYVAVLVVIIIGGVILNLLGSDALDPGKMIVGGRKLRGKTRGHL